MNKLTQKQLASVKKCRYYVEIVRKSQINLTVIFKNTLQIRRNVNKELESNLKIIFENNGLKSDYILLTLVVCT